MNQGAGRAGAARPGGTDWREVAAGKAERYARGTVMLGNAAWAAGLASLMAGDLAAAGWLERAAASWRASWDAGAPTDAWGRPIGVVKASLLAGDVPAAGERAHWALGLAPEDAPSPIGRYAAALALLTLGRGDEAAPLVATLAGRDDFPADVAAALAAVAAGDGDACREALASVVCSFETRDEYLEDVAVADTALVLQLLARRNGLDVDLPASPVLPA